MRQLEQPHAVEGRAICDSTPRRRVSTPRESVRSSSRSRPAPKTTEHSGSTSVSQCLSVRALIDGEIDQGTRHTFTMATDIMPPVGMQECLRDYEILAQGRERACASANDRVVAIWRLLVHATGGLRPLGQNALPNLGRSCGQPALGGVLGQPDPPGRDRANVGDALPIRGQYYGSGAQRSFDFGRRRVPTVSVNSVKPGPPAAT
jgi:hypothetical protein